MTYAVGDTVWVSEPFGWHAHTVHEYRVERVTPRGQVALVSKTVPTRTLRLNARGRVLDGSSYSRRNVVSAEEAREIQLYNRLRKLANDIQRAADDLSTAARQQDDEGITESFERVAQAIEARRAETATKIAGSVHESAVPEGNAP